MNIKRFNESLNDTKYSVVLNDHRFGEESVHFDNIEDTLIEYDDLTDYYNNNETDKGENFYLYIRDEENNKILNDNDINLLRYSIKFNL